MILIDSRIGSRDLLPILLKTGLPAQLTELESADIAFIGRGIKGAPLHIGVELKRLDSGSTDLLQSLQSGRLSGEQLPKMLGRDGAYDLGWLLVEGTWQHDDAGQIMTARKRGWVSVRGGIPATELEKRMLTLELCGGLHVRYTNGRADSVRFLSALYHWFTDQDIDQHSSHLAVYQPATLVHLSKFRKAVSAWPGIGLHVSLAVEQHFGGSLRRAANAGVEEWAEITTRTDGGPRRLGVKVAAKIIDFIK